MTLHLPDPLPAYFAAKNARDIDAMVSHFVDDAKVHDEGANHVGRASIRAWIENTTRKYGVTATPEEVSLDGVQTVVRALVEGDFPGSPARLTYRFTLAKGRIEALSIG